MTSFRDFTTSTEDFLAAVHTKAHQAALIMNAKAESRGVANLIEQGAAGVLGRMIHDKLVRIRVALSVLQHDAVCADVGCRPTDRAVDWAGVHDDLLDLANYAHVAGVLLDLEGKK